MTDAVIQVGTVVTKKSAKNIYTAICEVIKVAYECRLEQDTVRTAIRGVSDALRVENVTITHCYLTGDKVVNMGPSGEDLAPLKEGLS